MRLDSTLKNRSASQLRPGVTGHSRMRAATGVLACVMASTIASAALQDKFPDGPGKTEVTKVCSGCHDAEIVLANLKTPGEWAETLQSMAQQGADATPAEWG